MKKIAVLVVNNCLIAAIGNTRYMFYMVNDFLVESGKEALFDVKLVGLQKEVKLNDGLFTIQVDELIHEEWDADLIIIPPMSGNMEKGVNLNMDYVPWLSQRYKEGTEIASLCVGAFLLAETGLLNGKDCSTHWKTANEFRKRYPEINLVDDKIITDFNGIYTSGGSNSYWNLLVYLVEKYVDRETAILTSKYFEVEMNRNSQSTFMIFEGCKTHNDELVQNCQKYIEDNYKNKISVDELAEICFLSRRTFQRRFKQATHFTVVDYIQKVKIEAAKKLLESKRMTINEVMYEVGYVDPNAFRNVFKKVCGMTPLTYRNKYLHTVLNEVGV